MPSNFIKGLLGALSMGGGGEQRDLQPQQAAQQPDADAASQPTVPQCPNPPLAHYHDEDVCTRRSTRNRNGHPERGPVIATLHESGLGATLVPNQKTVVCPMEWTSLESPSAMRGLDTTWIVENTSTKPVVVALLIQGKEVSPFKPHLTPMQDPEAVLQPGEWLNVPTFDSFVYHVRELTEGSPGPLVLQHRVGMVPIGNPNQVDCDPNAIDVEPIHPQTAQTLPEFRRPPHHVVRPCNVVDISLRNQAGCPLHVYWAKQATNIPATGFGCAEEFRFHLGTKPATQDFLQDWESNVKTEGSYIGHTFVARLASDPTIVVDTYAVETTKVVECPHQKQQQQQRVVDSEEVAEVQVTAEGTAQLLPLGSQDDVGVVPRVTESLSS